jgi:selenocysteine lyase/cysteine desulfurase
MSNNTENAFGIIRETMLKVLETYSNIHRGSGHFAMITTQAYEKARMVVLKYLGLSEREYMTIFCNPRRAEKLSEQLIPGSFIRVSSSDIGLSLGVVAIVAKRNMIRKVIHSEAGGGTARMLSREWVVWAKIPDRLEAGTPAIVNVIVFAKALQIAQQYGAGVFCDAVPGTKTVAEILYNEVPEQLNGATLLKKLQKSMIGKNILVPTVSGFKSYINLDNAASTSAFYPVFRAASEALSLPPATKGDISREIGNICHDFLKAPREKYEILFVSNTTEGINLAAESLRRESDSDENIVINSVLEHNSNDLPWRINRDNSLLRVAIDGNGFIDMNMLETLLKVYNREGRHGSKRIRLVAVSGASNVLGVFNDLEKVSRIVHEYGALLLVDAAQMIAHRSIDIDECGIDFLAFSAHKAYAPLGCGVLVAKKRLLSFSSEEMEKIRSSCEENTVGIAAMGKAILLLQRIGLDIVQQEEQSLTRRALEGMTGIPGIRIIGIKDTGSQAFEHKGGVIVFRMKGKMPDRIARELALGAGIGIRYGCHCSHILIKDLLHVKPALERFQYVIVKLFPAVQLPGLARISIGIGNTTEDIDTFILALKNIGKNPPSNHTRKAMKKFVIETVERIYS